LKDSLVRAMALQSCLARAAARSRVTFTLAPEALALALASPTVVPQVLSSALIRSPYAKSPDPYFLADARLKDLCPLDPSDPTWGLVDLSTPRS